MRGNIRFFKCCLHSTSVCIYALLNEYTSAERYVNSSRGTMYKTLLEVKRVGKRRQTLKVDKFLGIKGILNFLKSFQLYIYIFRGCFVSIALYIYIYCYIACQSVLGD